MELIDKSALVAEIEKRIEKYATIDVEESKDLVALYGAKCHALMGILHFLNTLETKEVDFPYHENRDKELALSLQIQAYLNTASDELYGKGKPLYRKSDLEGIHECMKMWAKLHDYYFYKNTCKNKEVDLENSMTCKVDWYDGFLLDYTQEQQDELLKKIGANVGDKIRVILAKE